MELICVVRFVVLSCLLVSACVVVGIVVVLKLVRIHELMFIGDVNLNICSMFRKRCGTLRLLISSARLIAFLLSVSSQFWCASMCSFCSSLISASAVDVFVSLLV